jgi:hypothetical protein
MNKERGVLEHPLVLPAAGIKKLLLTLAKGTGSRTSAQRHQELTYRYMVT